MKNAHNMGLSSQPPLKKKSTQCISLSLFLLFSQKKIISSKNFMNLYSKTFYILNFQKKKNHGKVYPKLGIQVGLRVWSGREIFSKKIKTLWGAHKAPPIITKVKC